MSVASHVDLTCPDDIHQWRSGLWWLRWRRQRSNDSVVNAKARVTWPGCMRPRPLLRHRARGPSLTGVEGPARPLYLIVRACDSFLGGYASQVKVIVSVTHPLWNVTTKQSHSLGGRSKVQTMNRSFKQLQAFSSQLWHFTFYLCLIFFSFFRP